MRRAVLVTGSRRWTNRNLIQQRLEVHAVHDEEDDLLLLHGDCTGADTLAGSVAKQYGYQLVPMPADWTRDGIEAGRVRNQRMLEVLLNLRYCGWLVCVEAFSMPESKGTWHMVRIAKRAGVNTTVTSEVEA